MENKNESFRYTYSAKQQEEVKKIRQKYIPHEEDKMEMLRKLDKKAEKPGTIASILIGAIGTLLFGVGLTCVLVWTRYFFPGILVGVVGITGIALAFPAFIVITKKQREKLAPQIMQLSDDLMR